MSGDMVLRDDWDDGAAEGEVGEETAQAMLASVEEMLEGYEWASGELFSTGRGTAEQIQARLLNELMALEKVSLVRLILEETDSSHAGKYSFVHRIR